MRESRLRKEAAMGGGEKHTPDVLKGPPRDVRAQLEGAGADEELDACERPRVVEFLASRPAQAGTLVMVLAGNPPAVVDGSGQIGVLAGDGVTGVRECLQRGFEMTGILESAAGSGALGRLRLTGQLL